jgi:transcriptional regulator GlxA family with amidase domain
MADAPRVIVFAIFPHVTQLDFTGPHQVLTRLPGYRALIASRDGGAIRSDDGILFTETVALRQIPECAVLCVPGGQGCTAAMEDAAFLAEIRRLARTATWVTSVCTGSLILGAAGLLKGKRAACHWASREFLPAFGATVDNDRVVQDGNLMTGGGVTAGIDFALTLAAEIAGEDIAQAIQLGLEYAPAPPFAAGRHELAPSHVLARVISGSSKMMHERKEAVERAAARLGHEPEPAKLNLPPAPPSWKTLN